MSSLLDLWAGHARGVRFVCGRFFSCLGTVNLIEPLLYGNVKDESLHPIIRLVFVSEQTSDRRLMREVRAGKYSG